jgi:IclR family transcriptional regulator, pca regulon regulatory protein
VTPRATPPEDIGVENGDEPPLGWGLSGPGYSLAMQRGLTILAAFTPERPVAGIADIARELGMHKGTTHRYVGTLVALGYLEQGKRRKYRLTLGVTNLGLSALSAMRLEEHTHPYMQDLATGCGYTISLAVLDGPEILYLDRVHSTRRRQTPSEPDLHPGSRLPVHCTAMGKALLAHLPEPEQSKLMRTLKLSRETANTITGKQALRDEIRHITLEGIAVNDEELAAGWRAIAVPIRSAEHEAIAALAMSATTTAITLANLTEQLGPHLTATAGRISARLGYRRTDEIK